MKKEKLTILDADCLLFFTAWGFKDNMDRINTLACKKQLDKMVGGLLDATHADKFLGFFGAIDNDNFRYQAATIRPYKGTRRKEAWQEFFIPKLKEHYEKEWKFHPIKFMEADDAVVIAHKQLEEQYDITHISEDKDFKSQLVAKRFNPNGKKRCFESWSENDKIKHFGMQLLVGDASDNIAGVKGIGEESPYIKHLYNLENPTEEEVFEYVKMLYIKTYKENALNHMLENWILLKMIDKPMFDYPKNLNIQSWSFKPTAITNLFNI